MDPIPMEIKSSPESPELERSSCLLQPTSRFSNDVSKAVSYDVIPSNLNALHE